LLGRNVSSYSGNDILTPLFVEEGELGFIDQCSGAGAALTLPATYRLIAVSAYFFFATRKGDAIFLEKRRGRVVDELLIDKSDIKSL